MEFTRGRPPILAPPLYYLFLSYWIKILGNSESAVRLLSVLFGTLSILVLYRIGERIFDKMTGLIAAFLFSISTFHIYFSQEARMYSLLVLLTLCSMYYFLKLVIPGTTIDREGQTGRNWLVASLYIFFTILLLYTHTLGITPLAAQNLFALTLFLSTGKIGRLKLKNWIILQVLLLIAFFPWIIIIVRQFLNIQGRYWSPGVSLSSLLGTMRDFSSGSYWLLILFAIFSILAWFTPSLNWRCRQSRAIPTTGRDCFPLSRPVFLLTWLLVPILIPFIISIFSTPIYISRVTISASPALFLMVAGGIRLLRRRRLILGAISLISIISLPVLWNYYHTSHKASLREAVSRVEARVQPGDIVLIMPLWHKDFVFDYYQTRKEIPARGFTRGSINDEELNELKSIAEQYRRVWIILCQGEDISPILRDEFPAIFQPSGTMIFEYYNYQAGKRIEIIVYLLINQQSSSPDLPI
jgi:mannosyltransferase